MTLNGPMNAATATTATALRMRCVRRARAALRAFAIARPSSRLGRRFCCCWGCITAVLMEGALAAGFKPTCRLPENCLRRLALGRAHVERQMALGAGAHCDGLEVGQDQLGSGQRGVSVGRP